MSYNIEVAGKVWSLNDSQYSELCERLPKGMSLLGQAARRTRGYNKSYRFDTDKEGCILNELFIDDTLREQLPELPMALEAVGIESVLVSNSSGVDILYHLIQNGWEVSGTFRYEYEDQFEESCEFSGVRLERRSEECFKDTELPEQMTFSLR